MIDRMVDDLLTETKNRLRLFKPQSADCIRSLKHPVAALSDKMTEMNLGLKSFLFKRMYRHPKVNRMTNRATKVVQDLFVKFMSEKDLMPIEWQEKLEDVGEQKRARLVADYISGMTDRFALKEHRRQFDLYE